MCADLCADLHADLHANRWGVGGGDGSVSACFFFIYFLQEQRTDQFGSMDLAGSVGGVCVVRVRRSTRLLAFFVVFASKNRGLQAIPIKQQSNSNQTKTAQNTHGKRYISRRGGSAKLHDQVELTNTNEHR